MDANGLRFWLLADESHWRIDGDPPALEYRDGRLRLASRGAAPIVPPEAMEGVRQEAESRLQIVPGARDAFGTWAFWDETTRTVRAAGAAPGSTPILAPPDGNAPTDIALGDDGVLYVAVLGRVHMVDLRGRWQNRVVENAEIAAWRLAAAEAGGVWVLDRERRLLGRVRGLPLRHRPPGALEREQFGPVAANPDEPRLRVLSAVPGAGDIVAIARGPDGEPSVLVWTDGGEATLYRYNGGGFDDGLRLHGAFFPYSLAWISRREVAVMTTAVAREALVYDAAAAGQNALPVGAIYPLHEHTGAPFLHGLDLPPRYPTTDERHSAPLFQLSLPAYATSGVAASGPRFIDSGSALTTWHRLYLEAAVPANCAVKVYVCATNIERAPEFPDEQAWFEHHFGDTTAQSLAPGVPRGAWVSRPSELPFHNGLLGCTAEPGRAGLFTVLVQRSDRPVKSLRGRYLHVRIVLMGDGRSTPEVAALRAYGSRFSYVEQYLPALYHETLYGAEADALLAPEAIRRSTPADFLERFLDNFEGVLTPLEDRIAASYLLTDARATPDEAIEWLGSWIGLSFDQAFPSEHRRRLLRSAPRLYKRRGTLEGLRQALDIATDGGCARGRVIVLEDFRMRRTFATILGADLAEEDDPLLGGIVVSGNSVVGDTLLLGEETRREFLALFGPQIGDGEAEQPWTHELFERFAYQATVFVHDEIEAQDLGLIQRIVDLETPAHVLTRVVTASYPFMVSLASLVGLDTYLTQPAMPGRVRLDGSQVGVRDLLLRAPALDPRLEGAYLEPKPDTRVGAPIADAGDDLSVSSGRSFLLDGSRSRAAPGHAIESFIWTLLED